ncbi:MAG: hypothetical protein KKB31_04465 [Nanoarchaeota archaeon]|nr:hypothetical protein [Nanoarchaeota archaeon]
MVKKKVFYKVPGGYVSKERSYGTTYTQNKKTGRMTGRKPVKGKGDKTGVIRVKKDFVLVKKSKRGRGHIRKQRLDGQILGRY